MQQRSHKRQLRFTIFANVKCLLDNDLLITEYLQYLQNHKHLLNILIMSNKHINLFFNM